MVVVCFFRVLRLSVLEGGSLNVCCMRGKKGKNGDRKRRREPNSCVIVRVLRLAHLWTGVIKVVLCVCGDVKHG